MTLNVKTTDSVFTWCTSPVSISQYIPSSENFMYLDLFEASLEVNFFHLLLPSSTGDSFGTRGSPTVHLCAEPSSLCSTLRTPCTSAVPAGRLVLELALLPTPFGARHPETGSAARLPVLHLETSATAYLCACALAPRTSKPFCFEQRSLYCVLHLR